MKKQEIKKTESGFPYYDKLPDGFILAKLSDFLMDGKRKIGMIFLIQWLDDADIFQICIVSNNLNSSILQPFLESKRVYFEPNTYDPHA